MIRPSSHGPRPDRDPHHPGVIVLLFGAKKLPELARGSGRALRIFKAETKGLMDDDDDSSKKTDEQREIEARRQATDPALDTDAETLRQRPRRPHRLTPDHRAVT